MGLENQIERTGRKRRRKRILIALFGIGALALGGIVTVLLAPSDDPASRGDGSGGLDLAAIAEQPVTAEDVQKATVKAEAMQGLLSDLGTAVSNAGITDMKALEDLLAQVVVIATAADQMAEAVAEEDEYGAQDARIAYLKGVRDSRSPLDTVLAQLSDAGVDTSRLVASRP